MKKEITIKFNWLPVLGVLFVVLKLAGVIGWSWWWVTAPFWIGFALMLGMIVFVLSLAGIVVVADAFKSR